MTTKLFTMIASAMLIFAVNGTASAAPLSPSTVKNATVNLNPITKVHGYHRSCRFGIVHRWGYRTRHRHLSGNRVRECGRRWRRDYRGRYDRRKCYYIGPIRICD